MHLVRSCKIAAALLGLFAATLNATIVPRMSLEEIVEASESIVQGTVLRTWAGWDDGRQVIWTHYEIQVADQLKGGALKTIVVSEPGGTVGETALQIAGTPQYSVGEEVVLFAERTPLGLLRTCGWGQGKFRVQRPAAGKATVRASSSGAQLVEKPKTQETRVEKATPLGQMDGLDLDQFKARVKEVLGEKTAR